ncbi:hypothetical protein K456DRAFT_38405 [Colletotrichum gloeosporioides 23]|nr:hypothetical protein K456DRAFT_38405 [Colletotrichum gloeosporioides 23]
MSRDNTPPSIRPQRAKRVARACDYCRKKRVSVFHSSYVMGEADLRLRAAGRQTRRPFEIEQETVTANSTLESTNIHDDSGLSLSLSSAADSSSMFDDSLPGPIVWPRGDAFEASPETHDFGIVLHQLGIGVSSNVWDIDGTSPTELPDLSNTFEGCCMDVGGHSPSQHSLSDSGATSHLFSTSAHVLPFAKSSLSLANGKVPNIEALTRRSENTASLQRTVFPSMYIRKNESRGHYVGLGSVDATLAICLTDGLKSQQLPLKSDGLDFLIEAGPQVDEAGLSSLFDITSQQLPSKEAATKSFFECVAFFFPIIDRDIFMSRMEMMYTPQRPRLNALDYYLFHLVVSLGALVHRRTSTQTEDMDRIYLSSYQKAWSMISSYSMSVPRSSPFTTDHANVPRYSSTPSLGEKGSPGSCVVLPSESPNPWVYIRRALQIWGPQSGGSSFVVASGAYYLALTRRPPGISSGLYDKDICYLDDSQSESPSGPPSRAQMSNWWYKLSQIQNQYCAVMQTKHSLVSRLDSISEANQRFEVWKDSLPSSYRPDGTILVSPENYWHVVLLHLEYFNFLRTIHLAGTVLRLSCSGVAHQNSSEYQASEVICVEAARCFIKILNNSLPEHHAQPF